MNTPPIFWKCIYVCLCDDVLSTAARPHTAASNDISLAVCLSPGMGSCKMHSDFPGLVFNLGLLVARLRTQWRLWCLDFAKNFPYNQSVKVMFKSEGSWILIVLSDLLHQSNWNWQLYQKDTLSVILYRKQSRVINMLSLGKVSFWADAPSCPVIWRLYCSDRLIQLFMTWTDTCWQHVWHQRSLRPSTSNETCNLMKLWNSACQDFMQHCMSCLTVEIPEIND